MNQYTAIIKQEEGWWIGWIKEIPGVNCQEESKEELLISLKSALDDMLEYHSEQAMQGIGEEYQEELISA